MSRVKTFANGGFLLPGDLNQIEDDLELSFSSYKPITAWLGGDGSATTISAASALSDGSIVGVGATGSGSAFWLDPADFAASPRTVKYRIRAVVAVNAVAPGRTLTVGLSPMPIAYGASAGANSYTPGASVAGSTVAFTTPAANSGPTAAVGADFTAPAAGFYCLACDFGGVAGAANSRLDVRALLEMRQV